MRTDLSEGITSTAAGGTLMTARASRNPCLLHDDDLRADLAAFIMARAMAEMFRDEPGCPLPEALAAILRRMERWEDEQVHPAA
jgi:hypothetical protein